MMYRHRFVFYYLLLGTFVYSKPHESNQIKVYSVEQHEIPTEIIQHEEPVIFDISKQVAKFILYYIKKYCKNSVKIGHLEQLLATKGIGSIFETNFEDKEPIRKSIEIETTTTFSRQYQTPEQLNAAFFIKPKLHDVETMYEYASHPDEYGITENEYSLPDYDYPIYPTESTQTDESNRKVMGESDLKQQEAIEAWFQPPIKESEKEMVNTESSILGIYDKYFPKKPKQEPGVSAFFSPESTTIKHELIPVTEPSILSIFDKYLTPEEPQMSEHGSIPLTEPNNFNQLTDEEPKHERKQLVIESTIKSIPLTEPSIIGIFNQFNSEQPEILNHKLDLELNEPLRKTGDYDFSMPEQSDYPLIESEPEVPDVPEVHFINNHELEDPLIKEHDFSMPKQPDDEPEVHFINNHELDDPLIKEHVDFSMPKQLDEPEVHFINNHELDDPLINTFDSPPQVHFLNHESSVDFSKPVEPLIEEHSSDVPQPQMDIKMGDMSPQMHFIKPNEGPKRKEYDFSIPKPEEPLTEEHSSDVPKPLMDIKMGDNSPQVHFIKQEQPSFDFSMPKPEEPLITEHSFDFSKPEEPQVHFVNQEPLRKELNFDFSKPEEPQVHFVNHEPSFDFSMPKPEEPLRKEFNFVFSMPKSEEPQVHFIKHEPSFDFSMSKQQPSEPLIEEHTFDFSMPKQQPSESLITEHSFDFSMPKSEEPQVHFIKHEPSFDFSMPKPKEPLRKELNFDFSMPKSEKPQVHFINHEPSFDFSMLKSEKPQVHFINHEPNFDFSMPKPKEPLRKENNFDFSMPKSEKPQVHFIKHEPSFDFSMPKPEEPVRKENNFDFSMPKFEKPQVHFIKHEPSFDFSMPKQQPSKPLIKEHSFDFSMPKPEEPQVRFENHEPSFDFSMSKPKEPLRKEHNFDFSMPKPEKPQVHFINQEQPSFDFSMPKQQPSESLRKEHNFDFSMPKPQVHFINREQPSFDFSMPKQQPSEPLRKEHNFDFSMPKQQPSKPLIEEHSLDFSMPKPEEPQVRFVNHEPSFDFSMPKQQPSKPLIKHSFDFSMPKPEKPQVHFINREKPSFDFSMPKQQPSKPLRKDHSFDFSMPKQQPSEPLIKQSFDFSMPKQSSEPLIKHSFDFSMSKPEKPQVHFMNHQQTNIDFSMPKQQPKKPFEISMSQQIKPQFMNQQPHMHFSMPKQQQPLRKEHNFDFSKQMKPQVHFMNKQHHFEFTLPPLYNLQSSTIKYQDKPEMRMDSGRQNPTFVSKEEADKMYNNFEHILLHLNEEKFQLKPDDLSPEQFDKFNQIMHRFRIIMSDWKNGDFYDQNTLKTVYEKTKKIDEELAELDKTPADLLLEKYKNELDDLYKLFHEKLTFISDEQNAKMLHNLRRISAILQDWENGENFHDTGTIKNVQDQVTKIGEEMISLIDELEPIITTTEDYMGTRRMFDGDDLNKYLEDPQIKEQFSSLDPMLQNVVLSFIGKGEKSPEDVLILLHKIKLIMLKYKKFFNKLDWVDGEINKMKMNGVVLTPEQLEQLNKELIMKDWTKTDKLDFDINSKLFLALMDVPVTSESKETLKQIILNLLQDVVETQKSDPNFKDVKFYLGEQKQSPFVEKLTDLAAKPQDFPNENRRVLDETTQKHPPQNIEKHKNIFREFLMNDDD